VPAALVLHDVYGPEGPSATGFAGPDADRYKLSRDQFAGLLDAIAASGVEPISDWSGATGPGASQVALTFDDGGVGAARHTADMLERRGWRGCFLVVTDRLGEHGFLDVEQLRDLHRRGHGIGTHTRTHPIPLSSLADAAIQAEWSESRLRLEAILGAPIEVGSVPGGYYTRRVGALAEAAGIRCLYSSEPVRRPGRVGHCVVLGRYGVQAGTRPEQVTALLRGDPLPRIRAWAWWNLKKLPKRLGGSFWLAFRREALRRTAARRPT